MRKRNSLATPRSARLGVHYDPDAFGRFSEAIATFMGSARFLVAQTAMVILWITMNVAVVALRWDPYPFILLNLLFSVQAAYAAPLILLAQNRQAERDRAESDRDRALAARIQADAEYLGREIASVRLALADVVTTEDLRDVIDELGDRLTAHQQPPER
ncbi:MAG: DUF1003 domain-containing protein [Acidimicrobiia bacterium]